MEEETETRLKHLYPLHYAVFLNDIEALKSELESHGDLENMIEVQDIHGRTPLMLATILGHIECAEILLENGADANTQNKEMWSLSHEAILLKNSEFLKKVLTLRDYQRALQTSKILLELNKSFKDTPDFYVEMAWEFTSWLPFVKNMCPCDTYKIYKQGNNIRIDANMFEISQNERSTTSKNGGIPKQSFIFRFTTDALAEIIFLDRTERLAYVQNLDIQTRPSIEEFVPSEAAVFEKMKSPITINYINLDGVGFEINQKSGLLSWIGSTDKEEEVEGYACRVFNASNVEIVTKTCVDHLTEAERESAAKDEANMNKTLSMILGLFEKKRIDNSTRTNGTGDVYNGQTVVEYLSKPSNNGRANIGTPREEHVKTNSFNASLWLSESFPLNLREQIFPVIDLMAVRNAKFLRLKRFIELQMPSGFPIRIKIPLFHLINAQVTFRNVNEPNEDVFENLNNDENGTPVFTLKQSLFQIPDDFEKRGMTGSLLFNRMDEIERSHTNHEYNTVDVEEGGEYVYLLERFIGDQTPQTSSYEHQMQLAIEESLAIEHGRQTNAEISLINATPPNNAQPNEIADDEFAKALELSKIEEEQRRNQLEKEEEELRLALEKSLLDQ